MWPTRQDLVETHHDVDGSFKTPDGVLKSLGLHVGLTQQNKQWGYRFHTCGSFKNFNGLDISHNK